MKIPKNRIHCEPCYIPYIYETINKSVDAAVKLKQYSKMNFIEFHSFVLFPFFSVHSRNISFCIIFTIQTEYMDRDEGENSEGDRERERERV